MRIRVLTASLALLAVFFPIAAQQHAPALPINAPLRLPRPRD